MLGLWESFKSALTGYPMELRLESLPKKELEEHASRAKSYGIEIERAAMGSMAFLRNHDSKIKAHHAQALEVCVEFKEHVTYRLEAGSQNKNLTEQQALQVLDEAIDFCEKKVAEIDAIIISLREALVIDLLKSLKITKAESKELSILSIDLVQYGRLLRNAHKAGKADAVFDDLNGEIASVINAAVEKAQALAKLILRVDTGDGALVLFDCPDAAVKVAIEVHNAARTRNEELDHDIDDYHFHFRTGVATGRIKYTITKLCDDSFASSQMGGRPICVAVRLQAAASPAQVYICDWTWGKMRDDAVKHKFQANKEVSGKEHEEYRIKARPYVVYTPPRPKKASPKKRSTSKKRKIKGKKR